MTADGAALRAECEQLATRLDRNRHWPVIAAAHRDLATIAGQLQGLVGMARREHGDSEALEAAEEALGRLKAGIRQVGLDIRLASEAALAFGVQTTIASALETLDALDRLGE